jgi:glycerol-3-phosphate dehydrogenase
MRTPISPDHADVLGQVAHAVEYEGARTLVDVMLRRLTIGMSPGRGRDGAEAVAASLARRLNWDSDRVRAELNALDAQLALGAAPSLDIADRPEAMVAGQGLTPYS